MAVKNLRRISQATELTNVEPTKLTVKVCAGFQRRSQFSGDNERPNNYQFDIDSVNSVNRVQFCW